MLQDANHFNVFFDKHAWLEPLSPIPSQECPPCYMLFAKLTKGLIPPLLPLLFGSLANGWQKQRTDTILTDARETNNDLNPLSAFCLWNDCLCFLLDCFLFGTKGRCPPAVHTHPLEMPWKVASVSAYHLDTFRLVQSIPTLSIPVCPSPLKLFQAHATPALPIKKRMMARHTLRPLRQADAVPSCTSGVFFREWNDLVDNPRFPKEFSWNSWERHLHQWAGQPINLRNHQTEEFWESACIEVGLCVFLKIPTKSSK